MREILFRAKRLDNGEWVEGNLVFSLDADEEWRAIIIPIKNSYMFSSGNEDEDLGFENWYRVDPNTVCQFTGMTDIHDEKIFEGDVVRFNRTNALGWNTQRVGKVLYYDELPIFFILATTGDGWDWVDCRNIEVIGNIFDNPELMEDGGGDE